MAAHIVILDFKVKKKKRRKNLKKKLAGNL
jgi:hypothetical protein